MNEDEKILEELKLVHSEIERASGVQRHIRTVMLIIIGGVIGVAEKKLIEFDWLIFTIIVLIFLSYVIADVFIWRTYIQKQWQRSSVLRDKIGFNQNVAWPKWKDITTIILFGFAIILVIIKIVSVIQ